MFQKPFYRTAFTLSLMLPIVCFGTERKHRIGNITIQGSDVFTDKQLLRIAGIKPNQNFRSDTTESIVNRIRDAYLEHGFVKAEVSVSKESAVRDASGKYEAIDIKITINEGPAYRIRRMEVMGSGSTNDGVLVRFIRSAGLRPEGPYNPNRLDKWVEGLNRLGRFEPVKREDIEVRVNDQEHFADLLFHLKQKPD